MFAFASLAREIETLFAERAQRRYGLEEISQAAHALQAAALAEAAGEPPAMVLAALLHDVGHMVHGLGENPAADGVDDRHEAVGAAWLAARLGEAVAGPVRLHVAAKRYLCGTEAGYEAGLAPDSVTSLRLQGGPMDAAEAAAFAGLPFAAEAVRLRRWDDLAKARDAATPAVSHFLRHLPAARIGTAERDAFRRDGFIVLRDAFTPAEAAGLRALSDAMGAEATALLAEAAQTRQSPAALAQREGSLIVVPEVDDPRLVCRFEYLLGANAALSAFAADSLAPLIAALTGEAFIPFKDKENEKHPGGGAFRPHQDFAAYRAFGPRTEVTAMLTIDPATAANGCLEFAPGLDAFVAVHPQAVAEWVEGRPLLRFVEGGAQNGDIAPDIAAALTWQAVETRPRDLVLFDAFAAHRSGPNTTPASRRAMFLTYSPASTGDWYGRYYADKRAHYDDPKFHVSTPTAHAAV